MLIYGNNFVTYENIIEWIQQGKMPVLISNFKDGNSEDNRISFLYSYGSVPNYEDESLLHYEVIFEGVAYANANIDEPLKDINNK